MNNTLEFSIGGMHCASCSSRIERVLGNMDEVASAGVSLATDTARVVLSKDVDPAVASRSIVERIQKLGFSAEPLGPFSVETVSSDAASRKLELAVSGMHCAACSSRIERVVGALPEVKSIAVSLAGNSAQIELADHASRDEAVNVILKTISNLGFTAEVLSTAGTGGVSEAARRWEKRSREQQGDLADRKRDLIPAFAFALPLLVLSMGEMAGMPLPEFLSPRQHPFVFALAQLLLCLPVLWSGRRFFLQGLPALVRKAPNMDSLVALGTGAAFLFSLWNTFQAALLPREVIDAAAHAQAPGLWDMLFGSGHAAHGVDLYYESAAVVIALVSLGKYLESRSRLRTSEALKSLLDLAPETALRLVGKGAELTDIPDGPNQEHEEVPLDMVRPGDALLVKPGARIPVDGTVLRGSSFVDESMLTGESMPVEKEAGAALAGGTINQQGVLVMRAERVGADTMLARIVKLVQEAQGSKAPIAGMADRVSYYFVPVVMAIAIVSGLAWWLLGDSPSFALRIFVSVMVIACPCAMGLATPMAIMVGTGRGAQLGVLFKNGTALEQSSRISSMVFDKTGTLTEGKPSLVDIRLLSGDDADTALRIAASLESSSEHPLGRALVAAAREKGFDLLAVEQFHAASGKGVSGRVSLPEGSIHAAVGNAAFARDHMARECPTDDSTPTGAEEAAENAPSRICPIPGGDIENHLREFSEQGKTPVVLLLDGVPSAIFAIADTLRKDAGQVLASIKRMGISCVMLTGDNEITARAVAGEAGIDTVIAGVLPDGKEQAIVSLQGKGELVGMVGDGINDAPALARADVGFAVKSGIDVAVETGDVVLMRPDLGTVVTALSLGRAVMKNIKENLFWAFGYNIIGIPFAAGLFHLFGGPVLSPMLAGAAMALSSVSVVTNSLRLRFFTAK